ncbi:MAG: hypothetical protein H6779_02440 [Candidatus Nomurabacteria bacterium]|nr:hypothetical protein [Candidatus Nomurabacteria bacterium]USN88281.1 MAG: hypothetical protein H6779_02440 [Candidatus Nomurabacteria bacterium]
MEQIEFEDFAKLEIKIGTIKSVEIVPEADRLLKLMVDFGETEPRQIISGIRSYFEEPEQLVGVQCPFVTNLKPREIKGLMSHGMILATGTAETFTLLVPQAPVEAGAEVR